MLQSILKMSINDLMNVKVVTAEKREQSIKDIPASVVVITQEEIKLFNYNSLKNILENVCGVYVIDNLDFMGVSSGVRGYFTDYPRNIVFLINGVEQSTGYDHYIMQNMNIPVEVIDRIEIIKGPMSVIYGSGAFFGAINIITNQEFDKDKVGIGSITYGSDNTKKAAFKVSKSIDDLSMVMSAGIQTSDGLDESLELMVDDINSLESYGISEENGNISTGGRLENTYNYFTISSKYKDITSSISFSESKREELHFWPSPYDGLLGKRHFNTFNLGYRKEIFSALYINANYKFFKSGYYRDFDYFIKDFYGQEIANSEKHQFELYFEYKKVKNLNIISGFDFKHKDLDFKLDIRTLFPLSTHSTSNDIKNLSFYNQIDFKLFKDFKIVAGIRFDKILEFVIYHINNETNFILNENYESNLEFVPRIAFIYNINSENVIKLLYGRAVQFPGNLDIFQQKYSLFPDLEAEYITTFELNYQSKINNFNSINLSVFHNNLDNLISTILEFDSEGNWAPRRANAAEMVTNGFELTYNTNLLNRLTIELSGCFQKTTDLSDGFKSIDVSYSPELLLYGKASYYINKNNIISANARFIDEMETLWDIAKLNSDGSNGGRIADKVDSYFIFDINYKIDNILKSEFYLNLKCSNIFNVDYLYPLTSSNSGWANKGTFGPGRKIYISLGYEF